jgi:hypothetical protein
MSQISWNNPTGKRNKKSAKLTIGWRSPKGNCRLSSKPRNPHFVVLLTVKSVLPEWRKKISWPRLFSCRARLPIMYATPPMVSSPDVTSRILTVTYKSGFTVKESLTAETRSSQRPGLFFIKNSLLSVLRASAVRTGCPEDYVRHKGFVLPIVLCTRPLRRRNCKTRERGKPSRVRRPLLFQ